MSEEVKPATVEAALVWLQEAARYFSNRPTDGEDSKHWANVANATGARRIAALIMTLQPPMTDREIPWDHDKNPPIHQAKTR